MYDDKKPAGAADTDGPTNRQRAGNLLSTRDCTGDGGACQIIRAQGRVVGRVRDGVFHKRVRSSVHQLVRPPAWALDLQSFEDAKAAGAVSVELNDSDTDRTYSATVSHIESNGWTFDRGWGLQIGLSLEHWKVIGEDVPVQMSLELAF